MYQINKANKLISLIYTSVRFSQYMLKLFVWCARTGDNIYINLLLYGQNICRSISDTVSLVPFQMGTCGTWTWRTLMGLLGKGPPQPATQTVRCRWAAATSWRCLPGNWARQQPSWWASLRLRETWDSPWSWRNCWKRWAQHPNCDNNEYVFWKYSSFAKNT